MYSKSIKSGITYSEKEGTNSLNDEVSDEEADLETNPSHDNSNMIIVGIGSIFTEMEQDLRAKGKQRLEAIEKKYQEEDEDDESNVDADNYIQQTHK